MAPPFVPLLSSTFTHGSRLSPGARDASSGTCLHRHHSSRFCPEAEGSSNSTMAREGRPPRSRIPGASRGALERIDGPRPRPAGRGAPRRRTRPGARGSPDQHPRTCSSAYPGRLRAPAPDPLHPLEPDQGPGLSPGMLIGKVVGPQPLQLGDLEEVGLARPSSAVRRRGITWRLEVLWRASRPANMATVRKARRLIRMAVEPGPEDRLDHQPAAKSTAPTWGMA